MMDFISVPIIVGIVTLGIYKLFELFVRRKERLVMLEKGANPAQSNFPELSDFSSKKFGTLKLACLLLGVGMGLLLGFFINIGLSHSIQMLSESNWYIKETRGIIYGASVLFFGGLGLLIAFLLEQRYNK
jgi:hypothetical protein